MSEEKETVTRGEKVKMLRAKDVARLLAIPKSTLWLYVERGDFPKPIKFSERVSVWPTYMVEEWINRKIFETTQ